MDQSAKKLALVEPSNFNFNRETFETNVLQKDININKKVIFSEFDNLLNSLELNNISFEVLKSPDNAPDSIYPNNWVITFDDGTYDLFSMQSQNRRIERSKENLAFLNKKYVLKNDLTSNESRGVYLEGTGSLVLDRINKVAYLSESQRSNIFLAEKWAQLRKYNLVKFKSFIDSKPVYHTNVVMFITDKLAGVCLESIADFNNLQSTLSNTHEILDLSINQVKNFSANAIVVKNSLKNDIFLISSTGLKSLRSEQIQVIENFYSIVEIDISNIEKIGGGSVRCMILELF